MVKVAKSFSARKIIGLLILLIIVAFVSAESLWKVYMTNKTYTVYFQRSANLTEDAYSIIDEATEILKQDDSIKLKLIGHTSPEGDPQANLDLSLRRAKAVMGEFTYRGISEARIDVEGAGGRDALDKNAGESNRSYRLRSSRVEIILARITKNPLDYVTNR
tara:strand:+ start:181 stop:666 length:486 start_codon:yes stop_codon:yes gene_type:complete